MLWHFLHMNHAVQILIDQKSEISQELDDLLDRVRVCKAKIKSIDDALAKLSTDDSALLIGSKGLKELVEELIGGQDEGLTPKEISDALTRAGRPTSSQSVSSTLSRLKGEGVADSTPSGRWIKKKASPSHEDDANQLGPGDGSRGQLSPVPPEGSIPSGSTHRPSRDDMDDEIPF
jgi:hypothetical protein